MAAKIDFQFCAVCRRNHNLGRRHIYSKNHCANTKHILNKYGNKVCEKVNVSIAVEERKTLKKVSDHWYHNSVDSTILMLGYIAKKFIFAIVCVCFITRRSQISCTMQLPIVNYQNNLLQKYSTNAILNNRIN